ncbi:MAG: hypothetical protein LAP39_18240 [Acidobacteriia bacterium]|nr:hypothetical protein [Terriglobia bacterium]
MSVWPHASSPHPPALVGSEGELVSVSVAVEPRELEDLLEALAALDFPINPEIYHDAAIVYVASDGAQRLEPFTLVEFPAYAERLPKIRVVLETCGFAGNAVSVSAMLDGIHAGDMVEPAPPGANYAHRILRKHATAAAAGKH